MKLPPAFTAMPVVTPPPSTIAVPPLSIVALALSAKSIPRPGKLWTVTLERDALQVCRMAIKVGLQRPHDGNQLDADLEELLICAREALAKVDAPLVPPHGGTHPMSDHVPLTEAVYQHMREEIFHGGFVGSVASI